MYQSCTWLPSILWTIACSQDLLAIVWLSSGYWLAIGWLLAGYWPQINTLQYIVIYYYVPYDSPACLIHATTIVHMLSDTIHVVLMSTTKGLNIITLELAPPYMNDDVTWSFCLSHPSPFVLKAS